MTVLTTYKSPVPDRVYITRSALALIQEEATRSSGGSFENETGGILIGRRLPRANRVELLIIAATGPGDNAYHHAVEFNPDVDYVNAKLREYHARYPRTDYIGTWHKHPARYQRFSSGDVATAHAVFRDPAYKIDEIINPIVWVDQGKFTIRYYYMSRSMAAQGEQFYEVQAARVHVISDDHPMVQQEQRASKAGGAVNERIGEEYRRLRRPGFKVTLRHEQERGEYFFEVRPERYPDLVIYLIAPDGFPQVPPTLMVERGGEALPPNDGGVINQWSFSQGSAHLVEIVDGVLDNLHAPPPPTASGPAQVRPVRPKSAREILLIGALSLILVILIGTTGFLFVSRNQATASAETERLAAQTAAAQATAAPALAQATADARATAELASRWAAIPNLPPAEQIARLLALQSEGYTHDLEGTPVSRRLFEARLAFIDAELTAAEPNFAKARLEAEEVHKLAAGDSALSNQARDAWARVLLAEARAKLDVDQILEAENILAALPQERDSELSTERLTELNQLRDNLNTARANLSESDTIKLAWSTYDQGVQAENWYRVVVALDSIITITGFQPDPERFAPPDYDPRTREVGQLQADARLHYARTLWQEGDLEAAEAQIAELEKAQTLTETAPLQLSGERAEALRAARETHNRARSLWEQVQQALAANDWDSALDTLSQLKELPGFGPEAHSPFQRGQTVATLEQQAQQERAAALNRQATTQAQQATQAAMPTRAPTDIPTSSIKLLSITISDAEEYQPEDGQPSCSDCNLRIIVTVPGIQLTLGDGSQPDANGWVRVSPGLVTIRVTATDPTIRVEPNELSVDVPAEPGKFYRVFITAVGE